MSTKTPTPAVPAAVETNKPTLTEKAATAMKSTGEYIADTAMAVGHTTVEAYRDFVGEHPTSAAEAKMMKEKIQAAADANKEKIQAAADGRKAHIDAALAKEVERLMIQAEADACVCTTWGSEGTCMLVK